MNKNRPLLPIFLLALLMAQTNLVSGHGTETHEEAGNSVVDTAVSIESNGEVSVGQLKAALDSVYAVIGQSYKSVEPILKKSCYDCHSDQTVYPWYYKIPTIDAMIDSDIKEARKHLEMSNGFPFGGHASQLGQLHEIIEEVEENEMPLWSYTVIHWGTIIEGATQDSLFEWIEQAEEQIKAVYENLGVPLPQSKEKQ